MNIFQPKSHVFSFSSICIGKLSKWHVSFKWSHQTLYPKSSNIPRKLVKTMSKRGVAEDDLLFSLGNPLLKGNRKRDYVWLSLEVSENYLTTDHQWDFHTMMNRMCRMGSPNVMWMLVYGAPSKYSYLSVSYTNLLWNSYVHQLSVHELGPHPVPLSQLSLLTTSSTTSLITNGDI
jgi:hypothetical protein